MEGETAGKYQPLENKSNTPSQTPVPVHRSASNEKFKSMGFLGDFTSKAEQMSQVALSTLVNEVYSNGGVLPPCSNTEVR